MKVRGPRYALVMGESLDTRLNAVLLSAFENAPKSSVAELVQNALRVAVLRDDPLNESWLRLELNGISKRTFQSRDIQACHARLGALIGTEEAARLVAETVDAFIERRECESDTGKAYPVGIGELEVLRSQMQALHDDPIPEGMTEIDTGLARIERNKARETTGPRLLQFNRILERVRQAAFGYLIQTESEILRGQAVPDSIAEGRAFVDSSLSVKSPAAFAALNSAQDRVAQGDAEALTHAATSCRRAIKGLADALFPPAPPSKDANGVTRVLDDERYRNRLIEYVRLNQGKSTHADLLCSNINDLGTRLKSLDDLASKGVHAQISRYEAESCVSWTYMLAADLLRVDAEASGM